MMKETITISTEVMQEMNSITGRIKNVFILAPDMTVTVKDVIATWDPICTSLRIGFNDQEREQTDLVTTMLTTIFSCEGTFKIPIIYIIKHRMMVTDAEGNEITQELIDVLYEMFPDMPKYF